MISQCRSAESTHWSAESTDDRVVKIAPRTEPGEAFDTRIGGVVRPIGGSWRGIRSAESTPLTVPTCSVIIAVAGVHTLRRAHRGAAGRLGLDARLTQADGKEGMAAAPHRSGSPRCGPARWRLAYAIPLWRDP